MPRYQRWVFPTEARKNQLVIIVSREEGPVHYWINQNARLLLGYFDAGQEITHAFSPLNMAVFLFVIEGQLQVGELSTPAPRWGRRLGHR